MKIFVSGSLAYDRIMDFSGRFSDHIMPDKLHMINISFAVNGIVERPGGTAGNIAYALRLLGEDPTIVAAIGRDCQGYFQWLDDKGIDRSAVHVVQEEATACAHIITDMADNQITAFNPGAMKHPSPFPSEAIDPADSIAIIGPGNLDDMIDLSQRFRDQGVRFIFDPGQSLPIWDPKPLARAIEGSHILISNDYELALIKEKTGLTDDAMLRLTDAIITTKGEQGSVIMTDEGETLVPAIPRPDTLVDPTGAGDAYRGGLIKGLVTGQSLEQSCRLGATCASFAIEVQGTQEYFFTSEQFDQRFAEQFGPR